MSKPKNEQPAAVAAEPVRYRATEGFNHPLVGGTVQGKSPGGKPITIRERRVEKDDVVEASTLPEKTIAWGLGNGFLVAHPPPPPGALSPAPGEAGNLSLAQDGQLSEVKE